VTLEAENPNGGIRKNGHIYKFGHTSEAAVNEAAVNTEYQDSMA
jgi:hypothetical protein